MSNTSNKIKMKEKNQSCKCKISYPSSSNNSEDSEIICEGFLQVAHSWSNQQKKFKTSPWKKRYLVQKSNKLIFYGKPNDSQSKKEIKLTCRRQLLDGVCLNYPLWSILNNGISNGSFDKVPTSVFVLKKMTNKQLTSIFEGTISIDEDILAQEEQLEVFEIKACSSQCQLMWYNFLHQALEQRSLIDPSNSISPCQRSDRLLSTSSCSTNPEELLLSSDSVEEELFQDFFHENFHRKESLSEKLIHILDSWGIPVIEYLTNNDSSIQYPNQFKPVSIINGICIKEVSINDDAPIVPCLEACISVSGKCEDVFQKLLHIQQYHQWDYNIAEVNQIEQISETMDIVHIGLKPIHIWPMWTNPRDFCLKRQFKKLQNGSYIILIRSVNHVKCPLQSKYIRAQMHLGCYIISPWNGQNKLEEGTSYVRYLIRVDPHGWLISTARLKHVYSYQLMNTLIYLKEFFEAQSYFSDSSLVINSILSIMNSCNEREVDQTKRNYLTSSIIPGSPTSSNDVDEQDNNLMFTDDIIFQDVSDENKSSLSSSLLSNMWSNADASTFCVREKMYLQTKKKVSSNPSVFNAVAIDLFVSPEKINHAAKYKKGIFLSGNLPDNASAVDAINPKDFTIVINFQIPGPPHHSLVIYFQPNQSCSNISDSFLRMLHEFRINGDKFRSNRLKIIPRVVNGTWAVRKGVGDKPIILGSKLNQSYYVETEYLEVDCDVGSSRIATYVCQLLKGQAKNLVLEIAFIFEGQNDIELPEQVLGCVRLKNINLDRAVLFRQ